MSANGLPVKAYVYRGSGRDAPSANPVRKQGVPGCWCGNGIEGFLKHVAKNENPCRRSRGDVKTLIRQEASS